MKILVCGSRTFSDREAIEAVLNGLWWPDLNASQPRLLTIIEGGALGADTIAGEWADATAGVERRQFLADWRTHNRSAGPIRNQRMLEEGEPDLVLAFVNKPLERSVGTFDMVRRARQRRLPVWVIEVRPPVGS